MERRSGRIVPLSLMGKMSSLKFYQRRHDFNRYCGNNRTIARPGSYLYACCEAQREHGAVNRACYTKASK